MESRASLLVSKLSLRQEPANNRVKISSMDKQVLTSCKNRNEDRNRSLFWLLNFGCWFIRYSTRRVWQCSAQYFQLG